MEGFASFGLNSSNRSMDNSEYSASDRARRVSQSPSLHALLNAEIEKSGFVTSAGHKSVVQKFLYSDAVEAAMVREAQEREERSRNFGGRFRRLVSSDRSIGSVGSAGSSRRRARRRSSASSFMTALMRLSVDASDGMDAPPYVDDDGDATMNDESSTRNIAPRRDRSKRNLKSSRPSGDEDKTTTRRYSEVFSKWKGESQDLLDSASRSIRASLEDEVSKRDNGRNRWEEQASLNLLDGCDGDDVDDEGVRSSLRVDEDVRPSSSEEEDMDASYAYIDACADDYILRSLRRSDARSSDGTFEPWPSSQRPDPPGEFHQVLDRSDKSDAPGMDESGFLPWPERKEEEASPSGETDVHMASSGSLRNKEVVIPKDVHMISLESLLSLD